MAKRDVQEKDKVRLIVAREGQVTLQQETYEVVKLLDRNSLKVKNKQGVTMNVHKSRVRVTGEEQGDMVKMEENQMVQTETKEAEAKKGKGKSKGKAAVKKEPKPKKVPKLDPFDISGWIKEHGETCLVKKCEFDHATHELNAYICVDSKAGYYHTINVYKYPSGVISLGKKNTGGNKYPLKGKRMTKAVKVKETGKTEQRPVKGTYTAEQIIARYEKNGYNRLKG